MGSVDWGFAWVFAADTTEEVTALRQTRELNFRERKWKITMLVERKSNGHRGNMDGLDRCDVLDVDAVICDCSNKQQLKLYCCDFYCST